MKILYVVAGLALHGGVERVIVDRLNWIVENSNCEILLLSVYQGSHPMAFHLDSRIKYRDLNICFYRLYQYSGLKRFICEYKMHRLFQERLANEIRMFLPQIIGLTRLDFVCDVIKASGDVPVIFESHSSCLYYKFENEKWYRRLRYFIWHSAVKRSRMVIALTNADAAEWKKITSNVCIIPNVVHYNETGHVSDCCSKTVIFVGRYSYQKDINSLLRIWKIVHQRHPDWQLKMFGDYGDEQDTLVAYIRELDMNIAVHEPTSDICKEYLNSSMLLLTSRYEPFGLVLTEAMSCGLPVVSFNCPYGPADIINDGVDGFLIASGDVKTFSEKVCLLIENEELRRKMGREGMQSSQRFLASRVMPQWINLYNQCMNTK